MTAAAIVAELAELGERLEAELLAAGQLGAEECAHIMAAVRDARADLADLGKLAEQLFLVRVGNARHYVVEGLGELEIRRATKRTRWDNDGLTRRVVALALDERRLDAETGEYEPTYEAVARVLSECARPSWRVTPLRVRGIEVDEWCEVEPGAKTVQLPPRQLATPDVLGEAS